MAKQSRRLQKILIPGSSVLPGDVEYYKQHVLEDNKAVIIYSGEMTVAKEILWEGITLPGIYYI